MLTIMLKKSWKENIPAYPWFMQAIKLLFSCVGILMKHLMEYLIIRQPIAPKFRVITYENSHSAYLEALYELFQWNYIVIDTVIPSLTLRGHSHYNTSICLLQWRICSGLLTVREYIIIVI
jgi:hypothetical protein